MQKRTDHSTAMEHQPFKTGELILKQGDLGCNAYRILKGQVEVFSMRAQERTVHARLGPGEIFGEMGMIEDKPRSASVVALTPTEVEVVTPKTFNEVILQEPEHLVPYLKSFFERLRRANELSTPVVLPSAIMEPTSSLSGSGFKPDPGAVQIFPNTEMARQRAIKSNLALHKFPFRIGRWSENFQADVFVSNDLLVRDEAPFQISRNHCAVEREGNRYAMLDRGSALGTVVNGRRIGGVQSEMRAPLQPGENEIQLGGEDSPYRFRIVVS